MTESERCERWKSETVAYGHMFIRMATKDVDRFEPHVHSNGRRKYLNIYDNKTHDSVLCIGAPTYHDLFRAAQAAWLTHNFIELGKLDVL